MLELRHILHIHSKHSKLKFAKFFDFLGDKDLSKLCSFQSALEKKEWIYLKQVVKTAKLLKDTTWFCKILPQLVVQVIGSLVLISNDFCLLRTDIVSVKKPLIICVFWKEFSSETKYMPVQFMFYLIKDVQVIQS